MNKYEEALMEVEEIAYKQYEDACYNKTTKARAMEYERKLKDDTKILQELVDKAAPMKPLRLGNMVLCGKCHRNTIFRMRSGDKLYRCDSECGQVVDWSDENDVCS